MTESRAGEPTRACVIERVTGWVPEREVTNDELPADWGVTDAWVRARTGIVTRHRAAHGEATSDLALEAAVRALDGAQQPDTVVLATSTPDHPLPATAPALAARLGLGPVAAFDVSAVCSGFVYALATATGLIAAGLSERLLLAAADVYSPLLDPADRSTGIVFGDGAAAVLLRRGTPGEPGAVLGFDLGSDGGNVGLITVPGGGARARATGESPGGGDPYLRMRGSDVFKQAVVRMAESADALLGRLGWSPDDVDWFVGHQANARILTATAERIGIAPERCAGNIRDVGNTGAASIPLALASAHAEGLLGPGQRVLVSAFGAGLTWGSAAFLWPHLPAGPAPGTNEHARDLETPAGRRQP